MNNDPNLVSYPDIEPNRVAHLEQIQTVISRLAGNAFLIKGWAITVAGALFALSLDSHTTRIAVIASIPTFAFWVLDAYFLRAERLFRALYDEVRSRDPRVRPFEMSATGRSFVGRVRAKDTACDNHSAASRASSFFSVTLVVLYGGLLAVTGGVAYATYRHNDAGHRGHHASRQTHHKAAQALRIRSASPSSKASSS